MSSCDELVDDSFGVGELGTNRFNERLARLIAGTFGGAELRTKGLDVDEVGSICCGGLLSGDLLGGYFDFCFFFSRYFAIGASASTTTSACDGSGMPAAIYLTSSFGMSICDDFVM